MASAGAFGTFPYGKVDPDGVEIDPGTLGPRPPGIFELPPGCDEALMASADGQAHRPVVIHRAPLSTHASALAKLSENTVSRAGPP